MKRKLYVLMVALLLASAALGEGKGVTGKVYGTDSKGNRTPLPGANVMWLGTVQGTTTNGEGVFSIPQIAGKRKLVVSFIGYTNDTVNVESSSKMVEVVLSEAGVQLAGVTVRANQGGSYISKLQPAKVEVITQSGLQKLACCNLSESFENSASVTVGYADAVTGAKQIEMLGLSGLYSQLMEENMTLMRGIPSTYGLSAIPGSWMESIQVSKGAASVVNGYESITGQVNVEYKKPDTTDPLFLNLYGDSDGRMELNLNGGGKLNEKWSAMGLVHLSGNRMEVDHNNDGFLDIPKSNQVNLFGRVSYLDPGKLESRTGVKYLRDERLGGQLGFSESDRGSSSVWGSQMVNQGFSIFNKTGIPLPSNPNQSIGVITSYGYYDQNGFFGLRDYTSTQNSANVSLLYQSIIGNTNHKYVVGSSLNYDNIETVLDGASSTKEEAVPGAFAQYTYSYLDKLNVIVGARADHSSKYGWLLTPRVHVKYSVTPTFTIRVSGGRGYHSPNPIAENIGVLASSRQISIANGLGIEKAWNYGVNATKDFKLWGGRPASVSVDYYRTDFQNQMVVDQEHDIEHVLFYNLDGKSYSNSFQVDFRSEPLERFEVYLAYRLNDVHQTINGKLERKPLVNSYRALANLSYATKFDKWKFDFTAQLNGKSKLPDMSGYPAHYQMGEYSPSYPLLFAQITKKYRALDVYVGVENLLNYTQMHSIVGADNPFGPYFDSSFIWGPIMGRKIYGGLRWTISR
ncbi:TonB-dependent receptor [Acetobacteroides hydrogenigenes]|nr:TonB-dependent receptor [Acetobacteroides hydrogenigenes]